MAQEDYYDLLGLAKTASADDIKKAFRKMALKYHPDRNQGDKAAEEHFKKISEAYEVLSDAGKKRMYDQYGADGVRQSFGSGGFQWSDFSHADEFSDIFESVLGGGGLFDHFFGGGQARDGRQRGSDLRVDIEIGFMDAVRGTEKQIEITKQEMCGACGGNGCAPGTQPARCRHCGGAGHMRVTRGFFAVQQPCPVCRGAGQVIEKPCPGCAGNGAVQRPKKLKIKIPAGVDDGARLKVSGEGETGLRGAPAGSLYVIVHVQEHDLFKREGENVVCDMPISFPKAALGCDIEAPTVQGPVQVKIPAGTPSGKLFRIKGKGVRTVQGYTGDHFVRVIVETPQNLSRVQRELLEQFAASCGEAVNPTEHTFFQKVSSFFKNH